MEATDHFNLRIQLRTETWAAWLSTIVTQASWWSVAQCQLVVSVECGQLQHQNVSGHAPIPADSSGGKLLERLRSAKKDYQANFENVSPLNFLYRVAAKSSTQEMELQGVRRTMCFSTCPLSLASLVRSDSYFTCWTSRGLGLIFCIEL